MKQLIKKENLIGKYLPFEQQTELPEGSIVSGLNMLRKGLFGGWKPRRGYTLLNTTPIGTKVLSLHRYMNPYYGDFHLIAQIGANLYSLSQASTELLTEDGEVLTTEDGHDLLITTEAAPLDQRTSLGSSLAAVGSDSGFSCMVGEDWIYADGSGRPLIFGGDQPYCDGFISYDGASSSYIDYTQEVIDGDGDSYGIITAHADSVYYVGMKERGSKIHVSIETANTNNVAATVKAFRSGSWTDTSATDGTEGTDTHDTSGTLSWSASDSDTMTVLGNRQLYWYQISFSGAPTEIHISSCQVERSLCSLTNKWDGEWRNPSGALFYDHSVTEYIDKLGSVTDGAQSTYMDISEMQTDDYIYIKTVERALGFGFTMEEDNINTAAQKVDLVECMTSSGWVTVGAFTDKTLDTAGGTDGFAQTGTIWITNEYSAQESTLLGDDSPGYWYRLSVDGALSTGVKIAEILYASWPEALGTYTGCIEFLGKLALWGDKHYPNRLLLSDYDKPDFFCNKVERYSPPFGASDSIINCATIGNYIIVYKEQGIFMWDGEAAKPLVISTDIGLASPKTLVLISSGDRTLKERESRTILIHQDRGGIYKLTVDSDGYQIAKISDQIRNYFLPAETEYIGDVNITNLQAYYEKTTDTYRLVLPTITLSYSVGTVEWLPIWSYALNLSVGLSSIGPDNEYIVLAGTDDGFLLRLEQVTSDRDSSNTIIAINHKIKTRPIYASEEGILAITGVLRKTWIEVETDSGTITYRLYKNQASTGSLITEPEAPTLTKADAEIQVQRFDHSLEDTVCFQIELESDTIDQQLQLYRLAYQLERIRTVI